MKQNFKLIYTCGNTFRRGVTEPAISDHIGFDSITSVRKITTYFIPHNVFTSIRKMITYSFMYATSHSSPTQIIQDTYLYIVDMG